MSKSKGPYQPKTGVRCGCRRGVWRDNCPACEGTGWQIDFAAIRARNATHNPFPKPAGQTIEADMSDAAPGL